MWADLKYRLRALFKRDVMDQELEAELRFHLEHETEKHIRAGLSPAEAARRARIDFGGFNQVQEDARDTRGIGWLDALRQDVRYAWRGLAAKPGFTAAVVLTLGLGVGANTAMFGIVDRLLLRPPAYMTGAPLTHRVYLSYLWDGDTRTERNFAYRRYEELRDGTNSFEKIAAFAPRDMAIGLGEAAREHSVSAVSATFFDFFNARPVLGRFFSAEEDRRPAGSNVAVLGYGFWQSSLGGRRDVLGERLHIGDAVYTVIGVAPKGFVGIADERAPAVFVPITAYAHSSRSTYADNYNWSWLEMLVRRKPDVSEASANADLGRAFARSWESERLAYPMPDAKASRTAGQVASVHTGRGPDAGVDARIVSWVMGVAFIVLLVACANVVNLLLARAVQRRREIALRLALGITRWRLLQQLATETLMIAVLGGAVGLAAAQWGGGALRALFLVADQEHAVSTDSRTLLFTAAITLLLALLTGLAPALHALRSDVAGALKAGMRDSAYRSSSLRTGLLLFQAALSVVLLVGAGLFVQSLANVRGLRLGYDVEPILHVEGNPRGVDLTDAEANSLSDRLTLAAASVPGVESASLVVSVPFWSREGRGAPRVAGLDSVAKLGSFTLQAGSTNYFRTTGTRILRGRGFTDDDDANSLPIAVINDAMANALWPGQDPLGKQFRLMSDTTPAITVVGIAENMRRYDAAADADFWYFIPVAQYRARLGTSSPSLMVRVNGSVSDYVEPLRKRLQAEMPGVSYINVRPLQELVGPQQRPWEFGATMFVAFASLALILAAIGLYSVIAHGVAHRTRELGVRIALGANVGTILRLVVGQGLAFAVAGIALGSLVALYAARWVQPLLFSSSARDPMVFAAVALLITTVTVAATVRPALRATRVDPTVALRGE